MQCKTYQVSGGGLRFHWRPTVRTSLVVPPTDEPRCQALGRKVRHYWHSTVEAVFTDTIAKGMSAGEGVWLIKRSDANTTLYDRTNIVDMALQCLEELGEK